MSHHSPIMAPSHDESRPVRFRKENNPWYPLPPDYEDLTEDGKRLARLNAVRLQETPEDLVHAWRFFRECYLKPQAARWYKFWKPSPPMHYQMVWDLGRYPRNAWAAPRGFSKTTVLREIALLLTLTRPHFYVSLIHATIKKYRKSMDTLKWQLEHNPLLRADFAPYFGESLRPKRGDRPWGAEIMRLPNGSLLEGGSVEGALRGDRPDLLILDDVEYDDDEGGSDPTVLLADFETLLFKTLLPMLTEGSAIFWIGTLISRKSYLYTVTKGSDPRFQFFNRRVLSVITDDGKLLWPERWSHETIESMKELYGTVAFQSEFMNNPGTTAAKLFRVHPEYGVYSVDGSPHKLPNPLESGDTLTYTKRVRHGEQYTNVTERVPFGEFTRRLYRIMTVDYIRKPSPTSDYAAILVVGYDDEDTLWVLDLFLERVAGGTFLREIFKMAFKWQVRVIGTEAVSIQEDVARETAAFVKEMAVQAGYAPRVLPIKYARRRLNPGAPPTSITKAERIAALEPRFLRHQIRLPIHRRQEFAIAQLWHQIENFTLDLSLLRYDDALDTLAMTQYVPHRRGTVRRVTQYKRITDFLSEGNFVDEDSGLVWAHGLDLSRTPLPPDVLARIRANQLEEADTTPAEDPFRWPTGPIQIRY